MQLQETSHRNIRETFIEMIDAMRYPVPSVQLPDWRAFNAFVGGFRPREFSILCGGTGVGKTALLANMSKQLLDAREKHFVMSVETGHLDFVRRITTVYAREDMNDGDAVPVEQIRRAYERCVDAVASGCMELSLYENRVSVEQLLYDLRYMREQHGCKVAFIDNLNFFMEVTKAADSVIEMDRVIHELIIFCKQVDMHVVMVMHPKKTDSGRVMSEFDIKGSSTAVQEAHNVFLYNRPDADDIRCGRRKVTDRELTIAKMRRRGQHVGKTIVFEYNNHALIESRVK